MNLSLLRHRQQLHPAAAAASSRTPSSRCITPHPASSRHLPGRPARGRRQRRPGQLPAPHFRENDIEAELSSSKGKQPARQQLLGGSSRLPGMQLPGLHAPPSTTLPTIFRLHHHVEEGEAAQLYLLGGCEELGAWDYGGAVPMQCSEGDVWTVAVYLPARAQVAYRFLLQSSRDRSVLAEWRDMQLLVAPGSASLRGSCVEVLDTWPPDMVPAHMGVMEHLAGQVPQPAPALLPAVFRLAHHCQWGEHYGLLGSDERLGGWEPAKAVPMQWSEGDLWTATAPLPIGQEVQYKFVLLDDEHQLLRYCDDAVPEAGDSNLQVKVEPGAFQLWGSSAHVLPHLPPHLRRYMVAMPV